MRKYAILRVLVQKDGLTPKEIAEGSKIALPNCYTYLKALRVENLVADRSGKVYSNSSEPKVKLILDLQAMAPDAFDELISVKFGGLLRELSRSVKVFGAEIKPASRYRLKKTALPLRIALQLSKRPATYCLKVNEALVKTLLQYHAVAPLFSEMDFNGLLASVSIRKERTPSTTVEGSPELAKLCDEFYYAGKDLILPRFEPFIPDERVNPLLEKVELVNKEYQLFISSLDEPTRKNFADRWEKQYIYNTNSIEGNTMSEEQVEGYLKDGIKPLAISDREVYETTNMYRAIQYLKFKKDEDVSLDLMLEVHFQVQAQIREDAGYVKASYNYVRPNSPTTPPQFVKQRLDALLQWYKANKEKLPPLVLASIFHIQFEIIHPFSDGNGRVGRLIANHILRQRGFLPLTIPVRTKAEYYRAIYNQSLPQFLLYVSTSFIEEYRR